MSLTDASAYIFPYSWINTNSYANCMVLSTKFVCVVFTEIALPENRCNIAWPQRSTFDRQAQHLNIYVYCQIWPNIAKHVRVSMYACTNINGKWNHIRKSVVKCNTHDSTCTHEFPCHLSTCLCVCALWQICAIRSSHLAKKQTIYNLQHTTYKMQHATCQLPIKVLPRKLDSSHNC